MYAVIKNFMNGDKKVVYKTADLLQARDYAESLNEDFDDPEVDAAIAELKQKLEDVKATAYAESVDAGMRERRLRRALYKACANWAHFAVAFFSSYATKERWRKMENKCLAKAEEYR